MTAYAPIAPMYATHFGLTTEAFSLTPDPAFLYRSPGHAEALAAIKVGLQGRRGLMLMTGEVGTGKTTLLYSLLSDLGPEIRTAYISNTMLSLDDILRQALADFQVPCASRDRAELLTVLNSFLQRCATEGTAAALVIDEAHNLEDVAFENIRLLCNFETFTRKLLQIVLVGQPELDAKLRRPNLRQVAERIAVRCHVNPLGRAESRRYIAHRLQCAGGSLALFTPGALRLVVRRSQGIPRRINILCHNALLFAYGREKMRVSRAMMRAAVREREGRGLVRLTSAPAAPERRLGATHRWLRPAVGIAGAAAAGVIAGVQWSDSHLRPPSSHPAQSAAVANPASPWRADGESAPVAGDPAGAALAAPSAELLIAPARADESAASTPPPSAEADPLPRVAPAAPPSERRLRVTPGATLRSMVRDVYGDVTPALLSQVQLANPKIVDPNRILAGDTLRFPESAVDGSAVEGARHE